MGEHSSRKVEKALRVKFLALQTAVHPMGAVMGAGEPEKAIGARGGALVLMQGLQKLCLDFHPTFGRKR